MAVEVTCSKTGLVFSADSKRTKQHPVVASYATRSYRDGWYKQFESCLVAGREAGLATIAEWKELFAATETAAKAQEEIDYAKRITEYRQRKADAAARDAAYWQSREDGTYVPQGGPGNEDIDQDRRAMARKIHTDRDQAPEEIA